MHAIKRLRISALNFVSIYPSQGLVITKVFLAEKMSVSRECSLLFMSVILIVAGLGPALATWVLTNPVAATNAGIITADVAAQIASGAVTPTTIVESGAVKAGVVGANSVELAATRASVDDKLTRYLLNADHPIGGPKAKWFDSALGFNQGNAEQLANQIVFNEASAVQTAVIEQGVKFN